ncbi:MAG: PD-(D/E)XK nuclease family protein [Firmicutes bacterium]|nr:PD-(D/E)XK nuclease family protein [Bacillota bacterium]
MSLRFILGPAGSGKTHFCIHRLAAEIEREPLASPLLFLLPEQATFIHERQLAAACPGGGFCRAEVSSFSRLVYRAYQRAGEKPLSPLSEGGKLMLGAAVSASCREELRILAPAAGKRGFAGQVMGAAEELFTYNISPEQLEEAVAAIQEAEPDSPSAAKLREIALLYRAYRRDYDGRYGSYGENMAFLAAQIRAGYLSDTAVYIDGYSQFTPSERQVLAAMLAVCPEVSITLPLEGRAAETRLSMDSPFYPAWSEYAALVELARKEGVTVEPPLLLDGAKGRFAHSPDLAAATAWLRGEDLPPCPGKPRGLRLLAARDRREELGWLGREILRLCREEGLRFREIGLFARDVDAYQDVLPAVFDEMSIPYFIDAKKSLLYHPLVELVRAVLEVWCYRAERRRLLRVLKNCLHPFCGDVGDRLENYILRHGLRFWHWQNGEKPLPAPEPDEGISPEELEALRKQGVEPLLRLCRELGERCTAKQLNAALYQLFAELGVEERLEGLTQAALERGDGEQSEWHRQAWSLLQSLLEEAEQLLGEAEHSPAELSDLYEAAFSGLTISTIPPGVDQVMVASLERSRNPELKAAFVLSLNEGVLPRRVTEAGLFGDGERRLLRKARIQLAPDSAERQCVENYLVYLALSRCGERLYLSYLLNGEDGSSLSPSPVIANLKRIFPELEAESCAVQDASLLVGGPADLALCSAELSRSGEQPLWQTVYHCYRERGEQAALLQQVERGWRYRPGQKPLSRELLQRWYGGRLSGSVSRLEQYRRCPFAYFASYGLKTQPRREYQLSAPDRGTLYHQALAEIGRRVQRDRLDWAALGEEELRPIVEQVLAELLPGFLSGIMDSSPRYQYLQSRLFRTLLHASLLLAEHVRRSGFLPIAFELPFGSREENSLPAFTVPLPGGRSLALRGQIDRIDLARDGEKAWLRVVDYKTGKPSFDQKLSLAGLQLQLLLYLQVVMANAELLSGSGDSAPAGAYYAYVRDDLHSTEREEEAELPDLKLSGLSLQDQIGVELADRQLAALAAEEKAGKSQLIAVSLDKEGQVKASSHCLSREQLRELMEGITATLQETACAMLDGEIQAWPLLDGKNDACALCGQRTVCGFDRSLSGKRSLADLLRRDRPQEEEKGEA